MLRKLIFVQFLFSYCFISTLATHSDCGSEVGSLISLKVSNCDESDARCTLKRNTNSTIQIEFTSNESSDVVKAVVHGVILGVAVPFELPNSDGCKDCGLTCPIAAGQTQKYTASLPVLNSYPRVTVDVKWELQTSDGKNIVCVLIPSKIK